MCFNSYELKKHAIIKRKSNVSDNLGVRISSEVPTLFDEPDKILKKIIKIQQNVKVLIIFHF